MIFTIYILRNLLSIPGHENIVLYFFKKLIVLIGLTLMFGSVIHLTLILVYTVSFIVSIWLASSSNTIY